MANNPELLTRPLAEDGDKATIPDTTDGSTGIFSQQYGFQSINSLPLQAGGKAVRREDFNGAFNLLGGIAFYAQKGFTFNFDATQDYFAGCVVIDTIDGKRYECIADVAAGGSVPSTDTTHWKEFKLGGDGFEVGDIKVIAYNGTIPDKWFLCDGAAVSRDLYAKLYAEIGTLYGAGDGSTTFNLPDINAAGRFVQGSTAAGTERQAGLPNIEGSFESTQSGGASPAVGNQAGVFINNGDGTRSNPCYVPGSSIINTKTTFDASHASVIYGNSDTVQPPALTMRFLIKYEE